jgi:hypothetical protein
LPEPAWEGNYASFEICSCCFTQFGYDDAEFNNVDARLMRWKELREKWIADGMPWRGSEENKPSDWDAEKQLKKAEAIFPL